MCKKYDKLSDTKSFTVLSKYVLTNVVEVQCIHSYYVSIAQVHILLLHLVKQENSWLIDITVKLSQFMMAIQIIDSTQLYESHMFQLCGKWLGCVWLSIAATQPARIRTLKILLIKIISTTVDVSPLEFQHFIYQINGRRIPTESNKISETSY